jgi:glycosyltransferase involved in cell wall biosynthesis
MLDAKAAQQLCTWLDRCRLVTWEQRNDDARILTITNVWPHHERPAYGPFVKASVSGLAQQGVDTDVLFIRGYSGMFAYAGAALAVALLGLTNKKYALVHAHGGETALVARMYLRSPVVASYLGSDLLAPEQGGWLSRKRTRWRGVILRQHATLMSATTTKTREMEMALPKRARSHNTVIPDGVDLDRFRPTDRDEARAYLDWPIDSRIALFAGRADSPTKRLWLARRAVAIAQQQLPDLELRIASGVDPGLMRYYYSAADCLVHTSASEGSPNVVKEALACNLPIVATPAGDIASVVAGARPGFVVAADAAALAEAIFECCATPARSNGRSLVGRLGLDVAAVATLAVYRSVAGDSQAVPDVRRPHVTSIDRSRRQ